MQPKSEIYLKYKIDKDNKEIKILGDNFIKENKNKFKILINDKLYEPNSTINIENIKKIIKF